MSRSQKSTPVAVGALVERLRHLAQGRTELDIAQFHFIGFDAIRAAYGDRWPEQKTRIQEVAKSYLRRRIDLADVLISSDSGFVVVFGGTSGPDAEAAAGRLSHGLNEFFLGDTETTPAPQLLVTNHSLGVEQLCEYLKGEAVDATEPASEPVARFELSDLNWRFQPVWDVKHETLSSWYVVPYLPRLETRLPGYLFESEAAQPKQFASIDESAINLSEQVLLQLRQRGKQALVGVSIHAATLTNQAARLRTLALLDSLEPELFRYRLIKVAGLAPGFPRLYLGEIVQQLRARSLRMVVGVAWNEPDIAGLLRSGASAVSVALPASVVGPTVAVSPSTLWAKLGSDIQHAHLRRARYLVEGDITPAMALRIAALGADNICSPKIWRTVAEPDAMLKWPASQLLAA